MMIQVTDAAAAQIRKQLEKPQHAATGLRVGVKAGGCSGFEYVFAWEAAPRESDLVFEGADGVRVWVDPRSHRLLDGTTLDFDTSLSRLRVPEPSCEEHMRVWRLFFHLGTQGHDYFH
jgi:iron-sulfur cluster assembly protein